MSSTQIFFNPQPGNFFNADGPAASSGGASAGPTPRGGGGAAAGASPVGAIATAASSIINNTVDNLFQNKVYKSQAELLKAQAATEQMKARLMLLNAGQQAVLAEQLQQMNDENAKEKLLNDMVVAITTAQLNSTQYNVNEIYIAGLSNSGSNNNSNDVSQVTANAAGNQIKLAVIVLVASVIVVAAAVAFKK